MYLKSIIDDWRLVVLACLTLGLAPFFPEPHVWGKIKWVLGGANGMKLIDWFDLFLHGLPWLLLIRLLAIYAFHRAKGEGEGGG